MLFLNALASQKWITKICIIAPGTLHFNVPITQFRLKAGDNTSGDLAILIPLWSINECYSHDEGNDVGITEHTFCKNCGDEYARHPWPYFYPGGCIDPRNTIAIPLYSIKSKTITKQISLSHLWRYQNAKL
eukprot:555188_1